MPISTYRLLVPSEHHPNQLGRDADKSLSFRYFNEVARHKRINGES